MRIVPEKNPLKEVSKGFIPLKIHKFSQRLRIAFFQRQKPFGAPHGGDANLCRGLRRWLRKPYG